MNDVTHNHAVSDNKEVEKIAEPITGEHLHKAIVAKYNNLVDTKDMKFSFKTDKLGTKRPTVELKLPVLSIDGIVDILQNGTERPKELELMLDALAEVVYDQVRSYVNDHEEVNQENFPIDIATWAHIANLPKAERRGGGISKEVWEEFAADYLEFMPGATGKSLDKVTLAAKLLSRKFQDVKTQKPVIKTLQTQLGIYTNSAPNAEQYTACIEFLNNKAEMLLNISDADLLENL